VKVVNPSSQVVPHNIADAKAALIAVDPRERVIIAAPTRRRTRKPDPRGLEGPLSFAR
jgi:hypothetical protein